VGELSKWQLAISKWQLAGRRCAFSYRFTSCASFCKKIEAGFSWANCYLLFMLAVIWHKKAGPVYQPPPSYMPIWDSQHHPENT
jgi:hypothetical protein